MAKSRARFLSELLGTTGLVKKSKSALAGADEIIDLSTLPSIPNSKLTNSSITINSSATSLGGSVTLTTANVAENTNLYYTNARADARITAALIDEDNMSSDSATRIPSQQSVKAYVDTEVAGLVDSAPGTLNTLNELAAALGDDANFSTTVTNSIAAKLPLAGGTLTGNVTFGDNNKAVFGAGSDLQIYHSGSHSVIEDSGTGNLFIKGTNLSLRDADGNDYITMVDGGSGGTVSLLHLGSTKLATTSTGIDVTGVITTDGMTTSGNVDFGDLDMARFGVGNDLQIFHNGTENYIKNATSDQDFRIQGNDGGNIIDALIFDMSAAGAATFNSSVAANKLTILATDGVRPNDYVASFKNQEATNSQSFGVTIAAGSTGSDIALNVVDHDASNVLLRVFGNGATTIGGAATFNAGATFGSSIDVTGTVTADGLTVDAALATINAPSNNADLILTEGGSNTDARIRNSNGILLIDADLNNEFGNSSMIFAVDGTDRLKIDRLGDVSFYEDTGTTAKLTWDASAESLNFADNGKAIFGAGSDLQIYHDGTDSLIKDKGQGDLRLTSNGSGIIFLNDNETEFLANFQLNGAVTLYYDNAAKIATTSTGIDVTGSVTADGLTVDAGTPGPHLSFENIGGSTKIKESNSASFYYQAYNHTFEGHTGIDRLHISQIGDISFYEDTGTNAKFFWDASAEKLGIGETDPEAKLHVMTASNGATTVGSASDELILENSADCGLTIRSGSSSDGVISFADADDHNVGQVYYSHSSNSMTFRTNDAIQMSINSSGTVDVANDLLANNAKLKAIAESNTDTAVDVFVYDTRKDSDGGAWRKRTQHTSWYNETLNTSSRGARKEFPSVAVIVATGSSGNKVTIYDGDDPDMPMWMVFNLLNQDQVSISAMNGTVCLGNRYVANAGYGGNGFVLFEFVADRSRHTLSNGTVPSYDPERFGVISGNQADTAIWPKNSANGARTYSMVSYVVNDVAMTVLPSAPIDADTGLPVPTIAVATNGGVSVIKDNGTVVDIVSNTIQHETPREVKFVDDKVFWVAGNNYDNAWSSVNSTKIPTGDITTPYYSVTTANALVSKYTPKEWNVANHAGDLLIPINMQSPRTGALIELAKDDELIIGGEGSDDHGTVVKVVENVSDPESGMIAQIASDFATGYQVGDIKLATLSDTDTDTPASTNLVTNGTFDSTSNWTHISGSSTAITGGAMVFTNGGGYGGFYQSLGALTAGKSYTLSFDVTSYTTGSCAFSLADTAFGVSFSSTGSYSFVTAPIVGSDPYIRLYAPASSVFTIDNVSVRVAESDRSVNGKGLQVFGTVTKTAVATGAELVGYSGFSSSNYLQQPYNTDLNFGTGDFSISLWEKHDNPPTGTYGWFLDRDRSSSAGWILFGTYFNGTIRFEIGSSEYMDIASPLNVWNCWTYTRRSGTSYIYLNGELKNSIASTANINGSTARDSDLHIGRYIGNSQTFGGSLALVRISKTAPSPEQIAKMYNDEKHLFATNAKATLYGSSDAVTALAYDDDTELLHVGTSAGRSEFQGLNRVDNTTDAVGAAISASNGFIVEE